MKRTTISIVIAALLSGCAGLSVNFDMAASYRSDVPYGGRKDDSPLAPVLIVPVPAKAASGV